MCLKTNRITVLLEFFWRVYKIANCREVIVILYISPNKKSVVCPFHKPIWFIQWIEFSLLLGYLSVGYLTIISLCCISCTILFWRAFKTLNSRVAVNIGSVILRFKASYLLGFFLLYKYKIMLNVIYQIERKVSLLLFSLIN